MFLEKNKDTQIEKKGRFKNVSRTYFSLIIWNGDSKDLGICFFIHSFLGIVYACLYTNAVCISVCAHVCGCMWQCAHLQSQAGGQQASVILLFLPFHSPGSQVNVFTPSFLHGFLEFELKSSCSQSKRSSPRSHLCTLKNCIFPQEISQTTVELCTASAGVKSVNFLTLNDLWTLKLP